MLTKNLLIMIFVSYLNIKSYKTQDTIKDCIYYRPVLLTCVSQRELDIKALFDGLKNSQQIPPYFTQKLVWKAPLLNGEIPAKTFANYGAKFAEISANNLERIHSNAFVQSVAEQKILSLKFLPDQDTKLKNLNGQYDPYRAFSQMHLLQELSINLDWSLKHEIPNNAFVTNNWIDLENITFNGQFVISRIGTHLIKKMPKSFNQIIFKVTSIERIAKNAFDFYRDCPNCVSIYIGLQSTQLNENSVEPGAFDISSDADLHLGQN